MHVLPSSAPPSFYSGLKRTKSFEYKPTFLNICLSTITKFVGIKNNVNVFTLSLKKFYILIIKS